LITGILVNTNNQQEEKVLIAFLESLHYNYQSDLEIADLEKASLKEYNNELTQADSEIEKGNFLVQNDVQELFEKRRNSV
jgi:hypothetical protein